MQFGRSKNRTIIAFDIGTATVSATVFERVGKAARPRVLKTFRKFKKRAQNEKPRSGEQTALALLREAAADAQKFLGAKKPDALYAGFTSAFYLSKTERFYHKGERKFIVKEADIERYIAAGRTKFLTEVKNKKVTIFETVLMRVLLNGYSVPRPVGRQTGDLELWIRYAAMPSRFHDALMQAFKNFFADAKVVFSTNPITNWSLLRETIYPNETTILVDIGEESTEVTFLVGGIITDILVLPFGIINISSRIAGAMKIDLENAESLLKNYTDGALDNAASLGVKKTIKLELRNWETAFERVWQYASRDMLTQVRIFFTGSGALVDDLKHAVVPPLLHPTIAKHLNTSVISPNAYRDQFETFCCLDGPGDFALLSLVLSAKK